MVDPSFATTVYREAYPITSSQSLRTKTLSLPQISNHRYLKLGVLVVAAGLGISSILWKWDVYPFTRHAVQTQTYPYDSFALDRPIKSNLKVTLLRKDFEISDLPPEDITAPMGASPTNNVPLGYRMRLADGVVSEAYGWSNNEFGRWLDRKPNPQEPYQRSLKKILSMLSHALELARDEKSKERLSELIQSTKGHLSSQPGEHFEFAVEYADGEARRGHFGRISAGSTSSHFGPDVVWVGRAKGTRGSPEFPLIMMCI